ncbi:MAG TPA: hypothetical protein VI911_12150 [Patescibacteria group bacterium]|nr:hypothetical protein [Patescibacteria group bacterium]
MIDKLKKILSAVKEMTVEDLNDRLVNVPKEESMIDLANKLNNEVIAYEHEYYIGSTHCWAVNTWTWEEYRDDSYGQHYPTVIRHIRTRELVYKQTL